MTRGTYFAVILAASLLLGCSTTIGTVLRQNRFTELRPPSKLVPPGTVVQVLQRNPVSVGLVCTAAEALGEPGVQESMSENVRITTQTQDNFKLSADYLDQLRATSELKSIRSVSLTLSNVHVFEVTDGTFFSSVQNASPGCRKAVKFRIGQKQPVGIVKSVMQADVRYTASFDASATLDAQVRRKAMTNLAEALNANVSTATENTVDGQALYWGIRMDGRLAQLIIPETAGESPSALKRLARTMQGLLNPVRANVVIVKP